MNDPDDEGNKGGRASGGGEPTDDVPVDHDVDDEAFDDEPRPARPRPDRPANRPSGSRPSGRPPSRGSASGRQWDDDDDDWDDEDDWRPERGPARRDRALVVGIAAVILIVVLVVVMSNKNKNNASTVATTAPAGQPQGGSGPPAQTGSGGFCGNLPALIGGNGKVSDTGPAGVYIWNDFQGLHVRSKGTNIVTVKITGTAPMRVKTKADGAAEHKLYDASFKAWAAAEAQGGRAVATGNVIDITVPASPKAVGPNLDVSCAVTNLKFDVNSTAGAVAAKDIHIGDSGVAPGNPFSFDREAK